jgi:hypothetical protein
MTTVYTRTTCPIGRKQSEPCLMKYINGFLATSAESCFVCLGEWQERAALIADGCRLTQPQAEELATKQLREAVAEAENRQGRLF